MQHVQYQVNLISSIEYQVVITAIHHNLQGMQGMGRCCEGGDSNKAPSATLAPPHQFPQQQPAPGHLGTMLLR